MTPITPDEYSVGNNNSDTVSLSNGTTVTLPIKYRKWTMATAAFPAPISQLRDLLPSQLSPLRLLPRKGGVVLFSAEYQDAGSLDAYNEVGIMIPALHETDPGQWGMSPLSLLRLGRSYVKAYVQYLPVTTEEARSLGEIWGYPKEVAEVNIEDDDRTRRVSVHSDGKHVLTFEVDHARTRQQSVDLYPYTGQQGAVRARIETQGEYAIRPFSNRASYTLGDHPQANILRSLDMGERPLSRVYATNLKSRFHSGQHLEH
ncbi:acetoacetate decarboxylase family protein [Halococcus sp. AFM35]|uniref:acetoacetate decarboxylase family protein n=1 Tax=Halococcus sp. AFM35 TaxID=3421653 RepID=UPI003EC1178E